MPQQQVLHGRRRRGRASVCPHRSRARTRDDDRAWPMAFISPRILQHGFCRCIAENREDRVEALGDKGTSSSLAVPPSTTNSRSSFAVPYGAA